MSEFSEYMRLLPYGYAPGDYMSKCFACEKVVADVDKRATSCRPCAEAAFKDHEIERLRAEAAQLREYLDTAQRRAAALGDEVAGLREDAERLDFLLHKLPGDALRYVVGELSDTSNGAEFRAAIDAALAARKGEA